MATWRKLLEEEFAANNEDVSQMICTLSSSELDEEFDDRFGGTHGKPFTAWGAVRVYFPIVYDGAEWVGSAPRNPCDEATEHQGGG